MTRQNGVGWVIELENPFDEGGTFVQQGFGVHGQDCPTRQVAAIPCLKVSRSTSECSRIASKG
jgi:hypothetical protein